MQQDTLLTTYLQDRDTECPVCKYNLRDLITSRCPECGNQLELSLRVSDRRYIPWVILLISTSFGLPYAIMVSNELFRDLTRNGTINYQWPTFTGFLILCIGFIGALLFRRRFLLLSRGWQWAFASTTAAVSILFNGILIAATIRWLY